MVGISAKRQQMGHRAQYCIVRNGGQRWFHSHWGGLSIAETICTGPETAERDIKGETEIGSGDGAFDDLWCEGGCVLDWDVRRLLFFGGEYLTCSRRRRETFLRLIQPLWEGWTLHWASGGPSELAQYAGNDPQNALGRQPSVHKEYRDSDHDATLRLRLARMLMHLTRHKEWEGPAQSLAEMIAGAVARGDRVRVDPLALRDPAALTQPHPDRLPCLIAALQQAFPTEDWPTAADFQDVQAPIRQPSTSNTPSATANSATDVAHTTLAPRTRDAAYGVLFLLLGTLLSAGSLYVLLETDHAADLPGVAYAVGPVLLGLGAYVLRLSTADVG